MAQGRFEHAKRKRRKRKNVSLVPIFLITAVIVAACVVGTVLLLKSRQTLQAPETNASTREPLFSTMEPTTAPPTTVATTEATTVPTTEATTAPTENTVAVSDLGLDVADTAREQVGKPYLSGGTGPDGFDTSGLVYFCFRQNDLRVPRVISEQVKYGTPVEQEDLQPGDVVFFWTENVGEAEYVGIYVGGGRFVAARNPEKPVSEMSLTGSYFSQRYVCARRFG